MIGDLDRRRRGLDNAALDDLRQVAARLLGRAVAELDEDGLRRLMQRAGQLLHAERPVVVPGRETVQ